MTPVSASKRKAACAATAGPTPGAPPGVAGATLAIRWPSCAAVAAPTRDIWNSAAAITSVESAKYTPHENTARNGCEGRGVVRRRARFVSFCWAIGWQSPSHGMLAVSSFAMLVYGGMVLWAVGGNRVKFTGPFGLGCAKTLQCDYRPDAVLSRERQRGAEDFHATGARGLTGACGGASDGIANLSTCSRACR